MPAYLQDLRDRVLDAFEREERPSRIAQRFVVSRSWVYQVRDQLLKDGKRTVLQVGGYRRSRIEHLQLTLSSWIQEQSDLTLEEICARLSELGIIMLFLNNLTLSTFRHPILQARKGKNNYEKHYKIQVTAVWHQLDKWGLSFKKTLRASEREREDVRQARDNWRREQPDLDTNKLVFPDETWATDNMTRIRGRSPRGQRCVSSPPTDTGKQPPSSQPCVMRR